MRDFNLSRWLRRFVQKAVNLKPIRRRSNRRHLSFETLEERIQPAARIGRVDWCNSRNRCSGGLGCRIDSKYFV